MVILIVLIGLFPIVCAVMNFNWFFAHPKSRFMVRLLGRSGARIFYILVGLAVIGCGLMAYRSGQVGIGL